VRSSSRRIAFATARTAGLVVLAIVLILVILPAVLAAQAATAT